MSGDLFAPAQAGAQKLSPYVSGEPVYELAPELDIDSLPGENSRVVVALNKVFSRD